MRAIENPPAFPTWDNDADKTLGGMTMRDWFAGQALAMSQPDIPAHLADWAYRVADAMLAERLRQDLRDEDIALHGAEVGR